MGKSHFHTGIDAVLFAGISAIIVINLVRIGSAQLVLHERTRPLGTALAALV